MKNTILSLTAALFLSIGANAQTDTTAKPEVDTTTPKPVDSTVSYSLMHQSSYAAFAMQDTTKPKDTVNPQPADSSVTNSLINEATHAAYALMDTTKPGDTTNPTTVDAAMQNATDVNANTTVTADATLPENLKGVTSETLRPEHYLPVLGTFEINGSSAKQISVTLDEQNMGIVWVEGLEEGRFKALLKKSPATYKIPVQKTAEGKSVNEGVLIFDPATKEISIAIGSKYNEETPNAPFTSSNSKAIIYKGNKQDQTASTGTMPAQQ